VGGVFPSNQCQKPEFLKTNPQGYCASRLTGGGIMLSEMVKSGGQEVKGKGTLHGSKSQKSLLATFLKNYSTNLNQT